MRRGATGWHRHAFDYVVVPLADGVLELVEPDGGRRRAELRHGVPYFRNAGVEHDVINANAFELAFIETELKEGTRRRPGAAPAEPIVPNPGC